MIETQPTRAGMQRHENVDVSDSSSAVHPGGTPTLFVMVGLPGAGKTTVAKQLERDHRALRLTKDDWLMALFGRADLDEERVTVEDLLWRMGARALQLGVNVVLDYGLWAREEREDYRARAQALGARVEFHFLDVQEDELVRRLELRLSRGEASDVPITRDQLIGYIPLFQRPDAEELASWAQGNTNRG